MTPTPRPPRRGDLQHSHQIDVRLTRGPGGAWRGEVCRPGTGDRLCFLTLPGLLAWMQALEPEEALRTPSRPRGGRAAA